MELVFPNLSGLTSTIVRYVLVIPLTNGWTKNVCKFIPNKNDNFDRILLFDKHFHYVLLSLLDLFLLNY